MGELLSAFLAFPTVIYSILLVLVLVYWFFVFLGFLDIELFDLDGDADVDLDVGDLDVGDLDVGGPDVDLDVGLDHDVDFDVGHAGPDHIGVDHAGGAELGHDAEGLTFGGILASLGLSGVPLMVSMSFLVLWAWAMCMVAVLTVPFLTQGGLVGGVASAITAVVAFVLAIPIAAVSVKPFRQVFKVHRAPRRHSLVGRTCRITTQRVDTTFGQAEIDQRGATYLVQVRCVKDYGFAKDSQAIIFDYDPVDESFLVAPIDEAKRTA